MIVIKRALYGLSASGADWYRHLSTTLRNIGLAPTRFDRDVWIKLAESGDHYEYICTYMDDFMIASKIVHICTDVLIVITRLGPLDPNVSIKYSGREYDVS